MARVEQQCEASLARLRKGSDSVSLYLWVIQHSVQDRRIARGAGPHGCLWISSKQSTARLSVDGQQLETLLTLRKGLNPMTFAPIPARTFTLSAIHGVL